MQRAHCYLLIIGAVICHVVGFVVVVLLEILELYFYGHVKQVDYGKSHVPPQ